MTVALSLTKYPNKEKCTSCTEPNGTVTKPDQTLPNVIFPFSGVGYKCYFSA